MVLCVQRWDRTTGSTHGMESSAVESAPHAFTIGPLVENIIAYFNSSKTVRKPHHEPCQGSSASHHQRCWLKPIPLPTATQSPWPHTLVTNTSRCYDVKDGPPYFKAPSTCSTPNTRRLSSHPLSLFYQINLVSYRSSYHWDRNFKRNAAHVVIPESLTRMAPKARPRVRFRLAKSQPLRPTSPYWADGFVFTNDVVCPHMKDVLEKCDPLSGDEDDKKVVVLRNTILVFRIANLFLAFADRGHYYLDAIAKDLGHVSSRHVKQILDHYVGARLAFWPHPKRPATPSTATGLSRILCDVVDEFILSGPWRRYKLTRKRKAHIREIRDVWKVAIEKDIRTVLYTAPVPPIAPKLPGGLGIVPRHLRQLMLQNSKNPREVVRLPQGSPPPFLPTPPLVQPDSQQAVKCHQNDQRASSSSPDGTQLQSESATALLGQSTPETSNKDVSSCQRSLLSRSSVPEAHPPQKQPSTAPAIKMPTGRMESGINEKG
ncbi:hypothetical protein CONLIGDRAFT_670474 [Coniochaeta ligniaria NRRL 30616]|uniref:Uncharacterized protein n=1 Tax=Coniochaeta ligniaria NRRL 30616 TaxID=1408157 RepID=A0A1J7IM90_9PEZI|nr:hypothetical protein CONLIGDRAFT_670474 [Coniochaeta ligniaria NRRL 30616]